MSNHQISAPILSERVVEALTATTVAISGFIALLIFSVA
jgi:hypothetical protein